MTQALRNNPIIDSALSRPYTNRGTVWVLVERIEAELPRYGDIANRRLARMVCASLRCGRWSSDLISDCICELLARAGRTEGLIGIVRDRHRRRGGEPTFADAGVADLCSVGRAGRVVVVPADDDLVDAA